MLRVDHPSHAALREPRPSQRARFDPFRPLSRSERRREQEAYLAYLRDRDGEIDWTSWTLPKRQARMEREALPPAARPLQVDLDGFYQLFHRVGSPEPSDETLWASLLALANEGELYGVELEAVALKREGRSADELMVFHVLQEDFHTKLIAEACRLVGIEKVSLLAPRLAHRAIIRGMLHLPNEVRYAMVLIGEAIAAVIFERLRDLSMMFAEDPELHARLAGIIEEIRHDEILHTLHCRSRIPGPLIRAARAVVPIACWIVELAYPQIRRLGMDRHWIQRGLERGLEIPAGVDWVEA